MVTNDGVMKLVLLAVRRFDCHESIVIHTAWAPCLVRSMMIIAPNSRARKEEKGEYGRISGVEKGNGAIQSAICCTMYATCCMHGATRPTAGRKMRGNSSVSSEVVLGRWRCSRGFASFTPVNLRDCPYFRMITGIL